MKKIFLASSSAVYGNEDTRIQDYRSVMSPISLYGAAKLASEAFVSSFSSLHGFKAWIARFSNTVGPEMYRGVVPDLIRKLKMHPDELEVYGDGTQCKPYIWIDDFVDAVMCLLEKAVEPYNAYLVGVDSNVTVERIAHIVMEELDVKVPIRYREIYDGNMGDVIRYSYDVSRLRLLEWTPKYTQRRPLERQFK